MLKIQLVVEKLCPATTEITSVRKIPMIALRPSYPPSQKCDRNNPVLKARISSSKTLQDRFMHRADAICLPKIHLRNLLPWGELNTRMFLNL
ncbi:hypothetical protein CDAR_591651 [Caerostris darwini]|uniref:Uncharacterized protein n=1 Tax=Caerostris darwini TaxID=1538125 RepID=A0AAV4PH44_9ARAC|nr:hypothetical protein CDAR_591651 [Caerostris darwini]